MKRYIILILALFISLSAFSQIDETNNIVRNNLLTPTRIANALDVMGPYTATGTDTYAISPGMSIYAGGNTYTAGDIWRVTFTNANTSGTVTLNVNSDGAIAIKDAGGNDLAVGALQAGGTYEFMYNGTHFRMIGGVAGGAVLAGSGLTKTGSTIALGGTVSSSVSLNPNTNGTRTFNLGGSSTRFAFSTHYFNGLSFDSNAGWYGSVSGDGIFFDATGGEDIWLRSTESGKVYFESNAAGGYANRNTYSLSIANGQSGGATNDGITAEVYPLGNYNVSNILDVFTLRRQIGLPYVPSAGIGARLAFQIHDGVAATTSYAATHGISSSLTDVTDGSEDSKYTFSTVVAGAETSILDIDQYGVKYLSDYSANWTDDHVITKAKAEPKYLTNDRKTADYELVLTDASKVIEMNVAGANVLTIPLNASVAFPTGTRITIVQYGAGQTTITPTGGVTLRSSSGGYTTPAQYAPVVIEKIATDEWYIWNGLPEKTWTSFTPTVTGFSGTPTATGDYIKDGKLVTLRITISGTSNATGFTITNLPYAANKISHHLCWIVNNAVHGSGVATTAVGSQVLTLAPTPGGSSTGWTNSGNKGLFVTINYESQ
jgi:hypothetical protein